MTNTVLPSPENNRFVIFASYGNDSVALIQWAHENNLKNVTVLYNDTGWSHESWRDRVSNMEEWVQNLGFTASRTQSIGLEKLVKDRKGWPRQGLQFCTMWLKIYPSAEWLEEFDPDCETICLVGVRREESSNRKSFPVYQVKSEQYGDRDLWAPLAEHKESERDALLERAGVEPLPHRSMECFPCINSNRRDLKLLAEHPEKIAEIERIETDLGFTSKGKPRTMFRPYRHMGATGIREVVRWAEADHGKYKPSDNEAEPESGCNTGWCGI